MLKLAQLISNVWVILAFKNQVFTDTVSSSKVV